MSDTITFFNIQSDKFIFKHLRDNTMDPERFFTHTHEVPELLYIVEADGCHIIEEKEYPLKPGDLIVVPPATYHCIKLYSNAPYERYNICFDPAILNTIDVNRVYQKIKVMNCIGHHTIADIFPKTDYYSNCLSAENFVDMAQMLIKEIFYNLSIYNGPSHEKAYVLNPILADALDYINKNLYTLTSVSEISQKLFVTEGYLYEIFKARLQISPKKYITAKRLHAARRKIAQGARPTDVYETVGFHDYTSFYRNYTRFFGHSPSQEKDFGFSNEKF